MLEHQQSHTDNYRFRCSTCNKGFTRRSYYRDHKCLAAGNGSAGEGTAAEEDGAEELAEENGDDDDDGRSFTGGVKRAGTSRDDGTEDDGSKDGDELKDGEEGEGRRMDCETQGQMQRGEEDRTEHGAETLAQIHGGMNCLQQPCL